MIKREKIRKYESKIANKPKYIKRINVKNLFGRYTYAIPTDEGCGDISKLLLLYGDNGSGKTTVLRTVFNLLYPRVGGGIRTNIAHTPFKSFSVTFDNDMVVRVRRTESGALTGNYYISLSDRSQVFFQSEFKLDEEGGIKLRDNPKVDEYSAWLQAFGLQTFFLPDDRKIRGMPDDEDYDESYTFEEHIIHGAEGPRRIRRRVPPDRRKDPEPYLNASNAAGRLTRWIRDTALNASNIGDLSANDIYLKLLKRISAGTRSTEIGSEETREQLEGKVREIHEESDTYIRYGFMSKFPADEILSVLNEAPSSTLPTLSLVMQPYIESMEARLSALGDLEKTVRVFLETLSSFYVDKNVYFDMRHGISVRTDNDENIDLQSLSSGERQLMTMLSNTIIASDSTSIFIIDEPEISLNVKWQRTFLDALLTLTEGRNVQFVMATHSIELLSQHTDKVARLEVE